MADDKLALRALLEKGSDATFLREVIGYAVVLNYDAAGVPDAIRDDILRTDRWCSRGQWIEGRPRVVHYRCLG